MRDQATYQADACDNIHFSEIYSDLNELIQLTKNKVEMISAKSCDNFGSLIDTIQRNA